MQSKGPDGGSARVMSSSTSFYHWKRVKGRNISVGFSSLRPEWQDRAGEGRD